MIERSRGLNRSLDHVTNVSHLRRNLRRLKRWQPKYNKSTVASGIVFILRFPPEVDFPDSLDFYRPEVDFLTGSGTGTLNLYDESFHT